MNEKKSLLDAYNEAVYPVGDHGERNVQILLESLQSISGNLASDMYGKGKVIEDFQNQMADYVGKETAVFFPSGTMAQQIALRIWCDRHGVKKVAYHPLCHLEIHEENGLKELHHIQPILLADKNRLITLNDVKNMQEDIACLLLELPQREIGGQLPNYAELEAISSYCREQGIKLHMDGARLFEILPYYQKTAAEVCSLFDSVYVSFYKGIGGIAGAILAGSKDFTDESKVWKRRHGGDLISLYPYILSSDYYFNQRIDKMGEYYEQAKELAAMFNQCERVTTNPTEPVSNMFHIHFDMPKKQLESILIRIYETTDVGLIANLTENSETTCYCEMSMGDRYAGLPLEKVMTAIQQLDKAMKR